jgi:N6-adenosine-specific RNA methylase IME4
MNYLGSYVVSDKISGYVTQITDDALILHNGDLIPLETAPLPLWQPATDGLAVSLLPILGKPPIEQISTLLPTWDYTGNIADLPRPTYTDRYKDWTIGAVFKDAKLSQIQITNEHGTWHRTLQEPAKAHKSDCFLLGQTTIDQINATLCHLPDPKSLSYEISQDSEAKTDVTENPVGGVDVVDSEQASEICEHVPYESLIRDAGTQQRQALQQSKIEEYCDRFLAGEEAPPADVYRTADGDILKHGFHRDAGRRRALAHVRQAIEIHDMMPGFDGEQTTIDGLRRELDDLGLLDTPKDQLSALEQWLAQGLWCKITHSDRLSAIWDSCADNADNGATRTRADLQRAIDTALQHPNGRTLSNTDIARHVKTTARTVAKRRIQLESAGRIAKQDAVQAVRNGKTYTMTVSKMRVDKGRQSAGHKFEDIQALYAPFGAFTRYWDAIKKFQFEHPEGKKCHFKTLDEAYDKFAKVTDGLTPIADLPQPEPETPNFEIGDYVRGFDYNDGRRRLTGYVAAVGGNVLVLNTSKKIFALGAEKLYQPEDDRAAEKQAIAATIEPSEQQQIAKNNYALVVLDPPWTYGLRETDSSHRGRTPYPNMSDQQILDLPVGDISAPDSYCLLWATPNHLPLAFECLSRWGFEYKSIGTWVKTTKDGEGVKIGLGHYLRNCSEFFLIGVKGNPGTFSMLGLTDLPSVIHEAPTEHSAKPDKFYHYAHRLANALGGETIELFARAPQPGWDLWGAEAPTVQTTLQTTPT